MESFSKNVKEQLTNIEIKKKCCRYIRDAMSDYGGDGLREIFDKCRCDGCRAVLLRFLFIRRGSVTNPEKQYHLELSFKAEEERALADEILNLLGFSFCRSRRRERFLLYLKKESAIEDFLVYIGAQSAAFDMMNSGIVREFRNSVNRQVNCDTANIEKQLVSVKKYTDAIEFLIETGKIDALPEELRETALLREENEQLSLADLGKMLNPPVSKSGVRHRLEKILDFANGNREDL